MAADRVDHPAIGGAGRRDDSQRNPTGCRDPLQRGLERRGIHPPFTVVDDRDDRIVGEAEQQRGLRDAEVARRRGEDDQARDRRGARRVDAGEGGFPGEEERVQVGLRAPRGEDAVAVVEAGEAAHPGDEPALHECADRRLVVGVDRGVDGGEHRLGGDGRQDHRAVQVCGVGGVVEPHRVLEEEVVDLADRVRGADTGAVEVDVVDQSLQLCTGCAGGRARDPGEAVRDRGRGLRDERAVQAGGGTGQHFGHRGDSLS